MKFSLQNSIALAFAVLLVAGVAWYSRTIDTPTPPATTIEVVTEDIREPLVETDSDGDGLKDWEEVLWSTDPQNPDTDGDGVNDFEEINLERNPSIAGPNDNLNVTEEPPTFTESEKIAQDLYLEFLGKNDHETIAERTGISIQAITPQYEQLTTADITLAPNGLASLQTYGGAVDRVLGSLDTATVDVAADVTPEDSSGLDSFTSLARVYDAAYSGLRSIAVPSEIATLHLNYLNAIGEAAFRLKLLESLTLEPLVALEALAEFNNDTLAVNNARVELAFFLKEVGGYELGVGVY